MVRKVTKLSAPRDLFGTWPCDRIWYRDVYVSYGRCLSFGNADGVGADSRGSRRSVRVGGQLSSRVSC